MSETKIVVACCQLSLVVGDADGNRAKVRSAISDAARAGARVVVLPELANTGYMFADIDELRAAAEPLNGPTVTEWANLAAQHGLIIVGGFAESGDGGLVYNSAVLVDESGVRTRYRKAHLWNREKDNLFTPGSDLPPVVNTAVGRIGVMICYDLEFPEWVRTVALDGAELLCAPVNWPLYPAPNGERPTEIVKIQAGATVNRMFIAAAARVGHERGQAWLGGSVIVDADGFPLTEIQLDTETVVLATINLADARDKAISERNNVQTDRRPELYSRIGKPLNVSP
jgi:predicted amidohydrolase